MQRNVLVSAVLVVFFALPALSSLTLGVSGQSFLAYAKPATLIAPGETEVPITFTLINTGNTLVNVTISPRQTFPFELYSYYNSTDELTIPVWQTGQAINVTFIYNVAPTAKDGVYKASLYVNTTTSSYVVYAPVPVLGNVQISAQGVWGSPSSPLVVSPGETNVPLTIILVNQGNVMASNVSLELTSSFPLKFEQEKISVGYLPVGEPVEVTTYASIYPNATLGTYSVPITVNYFDGASLRTNLNVNVNGYTNFSITAVWGTPSSPITASAGSTDLPLTLVVRNLGIVDATNVTLYFQSTYPVKFAQSSLSLGVVPAGEINEGTVTASVYANATGGIYYIPVKVHYFDVNSVYDVPVLISSPSISVDVFTIPPQVFPGYYDVRVEAVILNYGQGYAENASIMITSPFEVTSQSNVSLGVIPSGRPINVTFLINVPNYTSPGNYPIKFTLVYDGGEVEKTFNLIVYPKAEFEVVATYYTLTPGSSQVPVTITLKNEGNTTAQNVIVRLGSSDVIYPYVSSSNPLSALTASTAYLGDVGPGQEVNVTFVVDVSSGVSPGKYPMALALEWNQTGSLYPLVQAITTSVSVSPTLENQLLRESVAGIPVVAFIVIIVILVIVVIALAVRSARKK
ncbi:MAG: hypothetical protein MPF33_10375 [Candidatus Aramenus sp.]|jgi:hypothetical protein|nr:hypothetical protein [Candidatus Aramenus sp.]